MPQTCSENKLHNTTFGFWGVNFYAIHENLCVGAMDKTPSMLLQACNNDYRYVHSVRETHLTNLKKDFNSMPFEEHSNAHFNIVSTKTRVCYAN